MKTKLEVNWAALPAGEKQVLRSVMDLLRKSKASPRRDLALAAMRWEGTIAFLLRLRTLNLNLNPKSHSGSDCPSGSDRQPSSALQAPCSVLRAPPSKLHQARPARHPSTLIHHP